MMPNDVVAGVFHPCAPIAVRVRDHEKMPELFDLVLKRSVDKNPVRVVCPTFCCAR